MRINSAAKSIADTKLACACFKDFYSSVTGINTATAAHLPGRCGISASYLSPTTDCSKGLLDQPFSILWSSPTTLNPKAIFATTIIGR
ncbi:hypothetical protein L2E82_11209 [Cichorium intybus]|uniref:Uncharacterized protein n=1 Tax=Cichorium intybus TaxID=13427 RepID=A0ACB9GCV4_CICIN|nr:hypothetical protein L2E82_11209 [Cichorium intybus]